MLSQWFITTCTLIMMCGYFSRDMVICWRDSLFQVICCCLTKSRGEMWPKHTRELCSRDGVLVTFPRGFSSDSNIWPVMINPDYDIMTSVYNTIFNYYLAPGGGCQVLFSPCLCVCVCVSVCPANSLVFHFSAIRRDIDLKCIQDTYMVELNSLKNWPS